MKSNDKVVYVTSTKEPAEKEKRKKKKEKKKKKIIALYNRLLPALKLKHLAGSPIQWGGRNSEIMPLIKI